MALLIFVQPFSKVWIVVYFKFNQENIAITLCVKKEIKNNTCQGKCHLKKQLEKADEEEQKQSPKNTKEKVEVLYCHFAKPYDLFKLCDTYLSKLNVGYENSFHTSTFITDIFRPPKLNLI